MDPSAAMPRGARPHAWAHIWWLLVGTLVGLGIEGLLTIGPFFLLAAGVLTVIGMVMPQLRNTSSVTTLAGIGLAVLYLAWLNRAGPGEVCEPIARGVSCTEQWSPWPFIIVSALLIAATVVLIVITRRSGARTVVS